MGMKKWRVRFDPKSKKMKEGVECVVIVKTRCYLNVMNEREQSRLILPVFLMDGWKKVDVNEISINLFFLRKMYFLLKFFF